MTYDVIALKKALDRYAAQRTERELAHARTVRELNTRIPRLAEIERELSSCGLMIVENVVKGGESIEQNVADIKAHTKTLRAERAALLKEHGLPSDLIDGHVSCPHCNDTGYVGSEMCACLRAVYREEQMESLSELFSQSEGRIETFDEMQYSPVKAENNPVAPREYMRLIAEKCKKYADAFSDQSPNLLFSGESGAGKTFFMACIARAAIEKNASVVYKTAFTLAKQFEDDRFSRSEDADAELERCAKCDLLLIDNLGTETTTAYTASALYQLLNRRIAAKHPTILATAMNIDEIAARYGSHMSARLRSDFILLPVYPRIHAIRKTRSILEI